MENNKNTSHPNSPQKSIVDKVAGGGRASMSDEPLTPNRKIEAELRRMHHPVQDQEARSEEDRQVANLGGTILTPQRKMENARAEMASRKAHKKGLENS
jgi:hypothetical protein